MGVGKYVFFLLLSEICRKFDCRKNVFRKCCCRKEVGVPLIILYFTTLKQVSGLIHPYFEEVKHLYGTSDVLDQKIPVRLNKFLTRLFRVIFQAGNDTFKSGNSNVYASTPELSIFDIPNLLTPTQLDFTRFNLQHANEQKCICRRSKHLT